MLAQDDTPNPSTHHATRHAPPMPLPRVSGVATELSSIALRDTARRAIIERLAYERARERGFAPGHELEDWLHAESEVALWQQSHHFSGD